MNRNSDYRRFRREVAISRRKRIIKEGGDYWSYQFEGCLAKGKIHCSCPWCSVKSSKEALMADKRKLISDLDELKDYNLGSPKDISKIENRVKLKASYQGWRGLLTEF